MTTQTNEEAIRADIQELKGTADLLEANIKEILEILPTLATKEQVGGLENKVGGLAARVDGLAAKMDEGFDEIKRLLQSSLEGRA